MYEYETSAGRCEVGIHDDPAASHGWLSTPTSEERNLLIATNTGNKLEDAIQTKLRQLKKRWHENDNTVHPQIEILEWALSLLKTDRIALGERIDKILEETSLRTIQASDIRPFLQWLDSVKTQIHAELESKSDEVRGG